MSTKARHSAQNRQLNRNLRGAIFAICQPISTPFGRLMLLFAGVLGAGGVIAAAAGSHSDGDRLLGAVALIALTQAPAVLAFGLMSPTGWLLRAGAIAIGVGACLFSGILAVRQVFDVVMLPMSAPLGAGATIVGWLLVAIAGLAGRR
jgi:uncharacterized membrane protein YgdD (TMEM256/DUF423 family)